jgi:hypothetical protein
MPVVNATPHPNKALQLTPKVLTNSSPGRGPHAGSPRGVEEFPTLGQSVVIDFVTLKEFEPIP